MQSDPGPLSSILPDESLFRTTQAGWEIDSRLDDIFSYVYELEKREGWTRFQTIQALSRGYGDMANWYEDWHTEREENREMFHAFQI